MSVGRMTSFRAVLEATGGNNVSIVVPESVVLAFNRGKRVPVIVTIDGGEGVARIGAQRFRVGRA